MKLQRWVCSLALTTIVLGAALAQAGMVTARLPVIVYDGPSENATPRYLLGKGYPLVVISETTDWLTVCMHDGTTGNVHRRDTRPGNHVIVLTPTSVRVEPNPSALLLLKAGQNLMLANTGDVINGWLPVRHTSGVAGFLAATDVWGYADC